MSYTPEVQVDSTGEWRRAAVSFATEEEAIDYMVSRASRGSSLLDIRVVESCDPVNYRWVNSKAERVTPPSSVIGMRTSRWTWRFAWLCVREAWERHVSLGPERSAGNSRGTNVAAARHRHLDGRAA
jgi:hypothetical protein